MSPIPPKNPPFSSLIPEKTIISKPDFVNMANTDFFSTAANARWHKIHFNFPLEGLALELKVEAIAELHKSEPYYIIHSFRVTQPEHLRSDDKVSFLPMQEIMCVQENNEFVWVHKDAKRATDLSMAIGKAIASVKD